MPPGSSAEEYSTVFAMAEWMELAQRDGTPRGAGRMT